MESLNIRPFEPYCVGHKESLKVSENIVIEGNLRVLGKSVSGGK